MTSSRNLDLDRAQKRMILERCPDLGGVAFLRGAVGEVLIDNLELRKYTREQLIHGFEQPASERALRVIVLGHVTVIQRRGHQQAVLSFGPMTTFGEEGVKAWNDAGGRPSAGDETSAIAKSETWVLELPVARFGAVFGVKRGDNPLLQRILSAQTITELMPEIREILAATPELADVDREGLLALLEGAGIRPVKAGEILATQGERAAAFFVMLQPDNAFVLLQASVEAGLEDAPAAGHESRVERDGPGCAGLLDVIHDRLVEATISVKSAGRVIVIPATTFSTLFRFNADFQRTIIRSNQLDDEKVKSAVGGAGGADRFVVVAGENARSLPIGQLTDLLAQSLAHHLYDRVLVVHAVRPGQRREATRDVVHRDPEVALEHRWIEVGPGDGLVEAFEASLAARAREAAPPAHPPDVTLLDASALSLSDAFARELATSRRPFKVIHLDSEPDALPPIAFIAAGMEIFYAGLLLDDDGDDEALGAVRELATSLAAYAQRLRRTLGDPRHLSFDALPPTWPRGAVRLRIGRALLAALRSRAPGSTAPVAKLGDPLVASTRATMDRWARAVTGRRVGLALGGGGTYGDVHVPLIHALLDARVPIDMVSGSSVGATVGAYFCARQREGLDLYWKNRARLLRAGTFGFITSAGIELAILHDLGEIKLDRSEVPLFPVVTDADSGLESDLRKGTFAFAVRASGSLPPLMGPTVQGDRRYLDGGLVANVPVNVLRTEGADVIIASNPISRLKPRSRKAPFELPLLGPILRESHPRARFQDAYRMVPMIFGSAGESQTANAHVVYRPAARDSDLVASRHDDYLEKTRDTALLKKAVADAWNQWRARLRNAPARVRMEGDAIVVKDWLDVAGAGRDVDPVNEPLVVELAAFLVEHVEIVQLDIEVRGPRVDLALAQAAALKSQLEARRVAPHRLAARGIKVSDRDPTTTTFSVVSQSTRDSDLQKVQEAVERAERAIEEAKREKRRADARTLTMRAEERARLGGLDLAGMLAIEAGRLDRSPKVDALLRVVLARRGRMVRSITARDASCLAWHPTKDLLAIGGRDGLHLWDTTSSKATRVDRGASAIREPAVVAVAFSPGGRLASAGADQRVTVHELAAGAGQSLELKRIFEQAIGTAEHWGVEVSPDGARVVTAIDGASDLVVWSVASGAELRRLAGGGPECRFVAWEPAKESDRIAAAMSDGTVRLWNATTGELLETIATQKEGALHLAWHPRGDHLAVAAGAKVKVLDLGGARDQRPPTRLEGHLRHVARVVWSHDGSRVATVGADLTTRIWDPISGQLVMSLRSYHGQFLGAQFHPGRADVIATRSEIGTIAVWDVDTGEATALLLGHDGEITGAAFHPRGELIATTCTDGTARLWDPKEHGQSAFKGHADAGGARLTALAYRPDGADVVLSADSRGAARLWKSSTNEALCELLARDDEAGPADAAWSRPDRRIAVVRSRDPAPILFDEAGVRAATQPARPSDAPPRITEAMHRVRWSPDGRRIAVNQRNRVVIWDADTGAVVREIASGAVVNAIAWHPSSKRLAVARGTAKGAVWIHDVTTNGGAGDQPIACPSAAWSVDFFASGDRLAVGCDDRFARLYDVATGERVAKLKHAAAVRLVAPSPDGRWLATGDASQTAAVWEVASGRRASGADSHGNRIQQLAWSLDSKRLASVSLDGIVCVWRRKGEGESRRFVSRAVIASARCRYEIAALSLDGKWLLTGDDEGEARLHPIEFEELVRCVGRRLGQKVMTEQEWARYMPADQARRPSFHDAPDPPGATRESKGKPE
jgi:WD40 repeat protein/predicted acylesterase/phospholipase RssA